MLFEFQELALLLLDLTSLLNTFKVYILVVYIFLISKQNFYFDYLHFIPNFKSF